jgi:SWIM zinc finger
MNENQPSVDTETFVISRTDEGFRVYSPAKPTTSYIVTGSVEAPACTCPDFEDHRGDLNFRCAHILAVLSQFKKQDNPPPETDRHEKEERAAIQIENGGTKKPAKTRNGCQMVIKRSVSPDGRIDSLSVEFALPVNSMETDTVTAKAAEALRLQSEIVKEFLSDRRNGNGKGNGKENASKPETDNAVLAQMLDIAGMPGKWGRRLFINVQVNGKTLKLFGKRNELSEAIVSAGFPDLAATVEEGKKLNLPCQVITKPSHDGKYLNVERVLPIQLPSRREEKS